MGRVIEDAVQGDFHPLIGLRGLKNFVKGKVTAIGRTVSNNPVVTLSLIDLDGSAQKAIAKGQYEEVDVNVGDLVQVIGSTKQLREKLPQLAVGDIVTITHTEDRKVPKGTMKCFRVEID